MVLYKGILSTNYRNAFILNSFFSAFVAVVAVNSNSFFNKLFQDIAAKTTEVVSSIKKNIKETVDKQDNPSYPIPTTPHPSHKPNHHHTYEPYESLTPTPPHPHYDHPSQHPNHTQDPHHTQHPHSTPHIYPHTSKIHAWLRKHLPFLSNIKYHTVISTIATFLFTYLIAFLVYVIMYVTVGFGGGMITGCDKFSCTWSGKGTIGETYTT